MTDNIHTLNRQPYIQGQMKLTKRGTRFTLEGNVLVNGRQSDHFQLIYEALEIAAASNDKFKDEFRRMCDELMAQTENWDEVENSDD